MKIRFFTTAALIAAFVLPLQAQTELPTPSPLDSRPDAFENGYVLLPDDMQIMADKENNIIRYFFDFSCVYCYSMQDFMQVWSSTVHDKYTFVYHHVATDDILYYIKASAMTFVANSTIPQSQKNIFMSHMFRHIGKVRKETHLIRLVKEAVADVGLDVEEAMVFILSEEAKNIYTLQASLQKTANIQVTPSILIGGEFMTHLGVTKDAQPRDWINLINSVTSIHLYRQDGLLNQR
jgi:hypothetical protein